MSRLMNGKGSYKNVSSWDEEDGFYDGETPFDEQDLEDDKESVFGEFDYEKPDLVDDDMEETDFSENFYGEEEEVVPDFSREIKAKPRVKTMSAKEAYFYSRNHKGQVDLEYMSSVSGISVDDLILELEGIVIWPDPEKFEKTCDYNHCFIDREQLLKGNLVRKWEKARELNEQYGLFDDTVKLLEHNMPEDIDPADIHMSLGATWIPIQIVIDFAKQLLDFSLPPRIEYNALLGKWTIETVTNPNYVKNCYTYGTNRMNAVMILRHILNATPVKVYDYYPKLDSKSGVEAVLNKAETLAAQQREKAILDAWQDYVHGNRRIEQNLQEIYMESYGYALSRYDGSFLEFPDLNPEVVPYDHQKNAIARILSNHNTLLAHDVGAGKSLEFMTGVHLLLKMELGKKALIVLPNTTFDAAVKMYQYLYPDEKILPVYPKKDFTPAQRMSTLDQMKNGEAQVILMAYSSFDMISLSDAYLMEKRQRQLWECEREIVAARNLSTRRALETESRRLRKCIEKYQEEATYNEMGCFEQLGIDILVVDEAHNYKNITLDNQTEAIVGVHSRGSKKADNMLDKVEYIQSKEGFVIFATGTPITNSMADLFVLQRYLQPEEMKLCHIFHFNDWVSSFCSQQHSFEVDVDSKNYRFTTRFSKFHNLPELMCMFSDICDFYQIAEGELGLPDFDGYIDIAVKKSTEQKEYIDELARRCEDIRSHKVKRKEDNLLKITVDGRKCGLDIRLVIPNAQVKAEHTKVGICAKRMYEIYQKFPGKTQIAFSDLSTPKEGFNIYDELKNLLVEYGIPEHEIMFIHEATTDAQRSKIEKRFNAGEIRILIGSTLKLGTGTNVQEKLVAVHHVDVPWRPADMVQREGRCIRQGNENKKVYIYRYVTEASFDGYTYQILENKQKFIAQFLSGSLSSVHREEGDCADTVLSYGEIKALAIGNPLIKKRVETANELEHAKINKRQKRKEIENIQELLRTLPKKIKDRKMLISNAKADDFVYRHNKKSIPMEERKSFGEELLYALAQNTLKDEERVFEEYQGFQVILPKFMNPEKPYIVLQRQSSNQYTIKMEKMDEAKALGCSKRIDYVLDHLGDTVHSHEEALEDLYRQQAQAEKTIEEGNEFDREVERLALKLEEIDRDLQEAEAS